VSAFTESLLPNEQTSGFSARLDSKGRITVPSQVRDRFSLEAGDRVSLCVSSPKVLVREVGGRREAIEVVESLDSVKSFSYCSGILEVALDE
jgi:AbrB family looped-hinge helix DNA binding protein